MPNHYLNGLLVDALDRQHNYSAWIGFDKGIGIMDFYHKIKARKIYNTLNNQFYYKYFLMLKKKIDHFLLAYYKMTYALVWNKINN